MIQTQWRPPLMTQKEADDLFMFFLEDDAEDEPWMVMGDLQFQSASGFAHSLRSYAHEQGTPWYLAGMLPIEYVWSGSPRKRMLLPDTFVAVATEHPRSSYDLAVEGAFPPFVLEVVSPSSTARDRVEKREAYHLLGVQEYALFTPRDGTPSILEGYRRDAAGQFVPWLADEKGRLWSTVLGLYLVVRGRLLQAQTPEGRLLLSPEQAEFTRQHAGAELQRAKDEIDRLRRELARQQGGDYSGQRGVLLPGAWSVERQSGPQANAAYRREMGMTTAQIVVCQGPKRVVLGERTFAAPGPGELLITSRGAWSVWARNPRRYAANGRNVATWAG